MFPPIEPPVQLGEAVGAVADPFRNTIELETAPERVWDLLVDFDRYHEWNPCVDHAAAHIGWLRLRLRRPGKRSVALTGSLVEFRPGPRVISWTGGHPLRGLVSVTYTVAARPAGEGRTRLEQTVTVGGLLKRRAATAAEELMIETGAAISRATHVAARPRAA